MGTLTGKRRLTGAALAGLAALVVGAPAEAHPITQPVPDAAYYQAVITGIAPAVPGLTVHVDPKAEWIEVATTTTDTVTVLGYLKEPYLRITAAGVDENELSQSTALNRSLFVDLLPSAGEASMVPAWHHISAQRAVRWHDHRIHWMGADRPPAVAADPTHPQKVGVWTVRLVAGTTPVAVTGELRWIGKPAARNPFFSDPALLVSYGSFALMVLITFVVWLRRRRARSFARSPA
jgi:hypothetical protein